MLREPSKNKKLDSEDKQKDAKKEAIVDSDQKKIKVPKVKELDDVDRASRDSFPASDPPSWWG